MIKPQPYTASLKEKNVLNENYVEYNFELVDIPLMPNLAGQYVMIDVPNPEDESKPLKRAYSMTQRPDVENSFGLLVAQRKAGVGVNYLNSLAMGEKINLVAPLGQLVVDDASSSEESELVFVATGAGIAPFRAMIADQLQNKNDQRKITLYWGMRDPNDFFWLEDWASLQRSWENFRVVLVASEPTHDWMFSRGRVNDCLIADGVVAGAGCYVCGGKEMVAGVVGLLRERFGVKEGNVHWERF